MNKKQRIIISALCVWSFVNAFILIRNGKYEFIQNGYKFIFHNGKVYRPETGFYPFSNSIYYYDSTELFVYVGGAWLIYFLYRFLKK